MNFDEYFKLKDITIIPTNDCNLRCPYCFEDDKNTDYMDEETIKCIIEKSYNNFLLHNDKSNQFVVNFFGGEPLKNWNVINTAVEYAKEKKYNISFSMTTNLTLLTDEMIDVIEDNDIGILVSIDGIKKIHNRNRCNTYDIVKNNVKKLIDRKLGYLLECRMTVMPKDVPYILKGIKEIVSMGITNIAPVPVTDTIWSPKDILKLTKELGKVWDYAIDTFNDENNKNNISIKLIEDFMEVVLDPSILMETQTKVCSAGTMSACSFGPTGDIMPCHQRHSIKDRKDILTMGNVYTDTIKEIEFNDMTINSDTGCEGCISQSVCRGGCPSENLTVNNNGNLMNEIQCLIFMAQTSVALEKHNQILNTKNIRSRRLNVLKENLLLLRFLTTEVITSNSMETLQLNLYKFFEMVVDKEDIILPNYNDFFNSLITELVNIIKNNCKEL